MSDAGATVTRIDDGSGAGRGERPSGGPIPPASAPWPERLAAVEETMREMSRHTDPAAMVRAYGARMSAYYRYDGVISLSRRDMPPPTFRITRYSGWSEPIDPWRDKAKQPVLAGGILGELLYADKPVLLNDFTPDPADPGYAYLQKARSLTAIPHYDRGVGLNMVVTYRNEPNAVDPEQFPEIVWLSNLFGRATGNLALSRELQEANFELDREAKIIADIQKSLLPEKLPRVPGLTLAASYQTSRNAGGDYYDFFQLEGGKVGMLIADVSGHGTPADSPSIQLRSHPDCRRCRARNAGGGADGDPARDRAPAQRAARVAGSLSELHQPAVVRALHARQRDVRDGVLRDL